MYSVFLRNWWRKENGRIVPNTNGRKTRIRQFSSEAQAREECAKINAKLTQDWRSRKAEYETF